MRIASEHKICSLSSYLVEYRKGETSLTNKMLDRIAPEMEYTLKNISANSNYSSKMNHKIHVLISNALVDRENRNGNF